MSESQSDPYQHFNYHFVHDFDGMMELTDKQRSVILESIRQQVKVNPGDEKRWDDLELPLVRRLCSALKIKCLPNGDVSLSVSDPALESTFINYARGSSWFSSVDLLGAVGQAMGVKN